MTKQYNDELKRAPAGKKYIYVITETETGKMYIGQTRNFHKRMCSHRNCGYSQHSAIDRVIQEKGVDAFEYEVLELCAEDEADERERYWIEKTDSCNEQKGFNIFKGGQKSFSDESYAMLVEMLHAFVFQTIRKRTRYTQSNYTRSPYKVEMVDSQKEFSYKDIYNRYRELENIDFECTLREYHNKTRCAFVPQELYYRVKLRDNYKCQHCGRQIRDSQKAYIDHVIPIAKGGKNIPSNLQVLCEMCNKRKHSP